MKKLLCAVLCVMFSFSAIAGNKKEQVSYYGPEQNSFAISFSAVPAINFVGNMFNGTTKQTFGTVGGQSLSNFEGTTLDVKYYVSDRVGLTVGVGFNCLGMAEFEYTTDTSDDIASKDKAADNKVMFTVGAQYLMRPGCRLQPVIGARLMYASENSIAKFDDKDDDRNDYKVGEPSVAVGAIGDLGVEYFFAKNFSLSAVANLGLYSITNKVKEKSDTEDIARKYSTTSGFVTGNLGGNLAFNFYF